MKLTDDERAACKTALAKFIADCKAQTGVVNPVTLYSDAMFAAGIACAQKWRSMESAPKDGTRILGFARKYYAAVCWDESGDGSFQWEDYDCNRWSPTHWMPLPLPPTEAK